MAPLEAYFPSLGACLSGDIQLISWKSAFLRLVSTEEKLFVEDSCVAFLNSKEGQHILKNPLNPFPPASPTTKSEYESKIAAIASSTPKDVKVDELKNDTLWLSKKCGIDELSALRVVVLEWQGRSADRLLSAFSEEEIISLQDAVGIGGVSQPAGHARIVGALSKHRGDQNPRPEGLSDEDSRRLRIWLLFLSERQHILKTAHRLLCLGLRHVLPSCYTGRVEHVKKAGDSPIEKLGRSTFGIGTEEDPVLISELITMRDCVDSISARMRNLGSGSGFFENEISADVENAFITSILEELVQILQILFVLLETSPGFPSDTLLLSWLRLMADYNFLEGLCPATPEQTALYPTIQALVSVANLAFLKLTLAKSKFEDIASNPSDIPSEWITNPPFFLSKDSISEINELFSSSAAAANQTASPAVLAWSIIMYSIREFALCTGQERRIQALSQGADSPSQRRDSTNSGEPSLYESIVERASTSAIESDDDDFVHALASGAVEQCKVFDVIMKIVEALEPLSGPGDDGLMNCWIRAELLDLLRSSVESLGYIPEIVSSVLVILAMPAGSPKNVCDPRAIFANDPYFMDAVFNVAKSRFPYESVTLLKICRVLAGYNVANEDGLCAVAQELAGMETYTQMMLPGFVGYQPIREEEDANYVQLLQSLPMVEVVSPVDTNAVSKDKLSTTYIPRGTIGQVMNETKPAVIMWYHQYNGFGFLGRWLEQAVHGNAVDAGLDEDTIADVIGLFADLLASAESNKGGARFSSEGAKRVLEMASDELHRYGDIISLVLDIFERNLQDVKHGSATGADLNCSISCLRFITGLLKVFPGRVWPFLARSSFLDSDDKAGILAHIVSAIEVTAGDFPFLLAAVELFQNLVDDAVNHAALRRTNGKISANTSHILDYTAGVPPYVMRQLLLSMVRTMVDIYNLNATWRFIDKSQQLQVNAVLGSTFEQILLLVYGVDDREDLDSKVTGVLSNSAQYLLDILRPVQAEGFPLNPILSTLFDGLETPTSSASIPMLLLRTKQTRSTISLSERLVQAGKFTSSPMTPFESQLFKAVPLLNRLYVINYDYRLPVVRLLTLLISYGSDDKKAEPPSLFGSLGSKGTCSFFECVSQFDRPFNEPNIRSKVWSFLSAILGCRQQWIAVFLLTGDSPRHVFRNPAGETKMAPAPKMSGKPFLDSALDILSAIEAAPRTTIISALEFISTAQEHWPWITTSLAQRTDFFPKILKYVSSINMQTLDMQDQCLDTRIAALVADICSIYIFSAKEARDLNFFKTLRPAISWYSENAVNVDGYNVSLHTNLKRNFEMKYPGFKLTDIKRTVFENSSLRGPFFYDTNLGDRLFGYDFAWAGSPKQSLLQEIRRANFNLFLVESQKVLLHSFKFLAVEHCASFIKDREIQRSMTKVVNQCLESNNMATPNEVMFSKLHLTRAQFAMGLLVRLVGVQARGSEVFQLLNVAWETIKLRHASFESALANDDKEYYTSLLQILFLALQFHVDGPRRTVPEAISKKPELSSDLPTIVEIVDVIVAQGFRTLTNYLHEEPQKCSPQDFYVITAILETTLKVKDVDRIMEQISFHLIDSEAPRYAATLFTWATEFTVDNDPVYGQVSIQFLLQLSNIPAVAEHLAVDNVFMMLSTSKLAQLLRQPSGWGPFSPITRFYNIWNTGILPLCLNILFHVNRAAPEIVSFLNSFPGQLERASDSFAIAKGSSPLASKLGGATSASGRVSLSMAQEASSLALICKMVQTLREAGASIGFDALRIEELKWDKTQVKQDIESLLEKRGVLRSRITPTTEREVGMLRRNQGEFNDGSETALEARVVIELRNTLICLGAEVEESN